jgi:glycosyltransferase involved in cell wall biosynthesis
MTALVVTNKALTSLSCGYDLRVWHLCRHLAEREDLVLVCIPLQAELARAYADGSLDSGQLFREEVHVPDRHLRTPSTRRHLRWREDRFYRWGYPRFYREAVDTIRDVVGRHRVERFLVFGSDLAEFMVPFRKGKVLFDVCDSVVLATARQSGYGSGAGLRERLQQRITLARWRRTERRLPHWFSEVTAISDADSATVRALAGKGHNVTTVPNGLDPRLERPAAYNTPSRRGVVFWKPLLPPESGGDALLLRSSLPSPSFRPRHRVLRDWQESRAVAGQAGQLRRFGSGAQVRA